MPVYITCEDELTVPPLTASEKKWIERLQRTLAACPDRLELVTIGDPLLEVVDAEGARHSKLGFGAAGEDGVVLARVSGKPNVHGVA